MSKRKGRKPKQPREDPVLDRVLDEILNKKHPVIPDYADLPQRWREAPSKASDRRHPWQRTKDELIADTISVAFVEPLAKEGLDRLYRKLVSTGQPVPPALSRWTDSVRLLGNPPLSRGPRRQLDDAIRVGVALGLLGQYGYSREKAIARIGKVKNYSDEGIRTTTHKYHFKMDYSSGSSNN